MANISIQKADLVGVVKFVRGDSFGADLIRHNYLSVTIVRR